MGTISNLEVKQWENILEKDQKPHFIKNWEHQAKRFGKKELLELFEDGYEYHQTMERGEDRFKISFETRVSSVLKNNKNIGFMKRKTFNTLMSLYGKFVHLKNKYGEELLRPLQEINTTVESGATAIKTQAKEQLIDNIDQQAITKKIQKLQTKINDQNTRIEELIFENQAYQDARNGLNEAGDSFLNEIKNNLQEIKILESQISKVRYQQEDLEILLKKYEEEKNIVNRQPDSTLDDKKQKDSDDSDDDLYGYDPDEPRWHR